MRARGRGAFRCEGRPELPGNRLDLAAQIGLRWGPRWDLSQLPGTARVVAAVHHRVVGAIGASATGLGLAGASGELFGGIEGFNHFRPSDIVAALAASAVPALRLAGIDTMTALREE